MLHSSHRTLSSVLSPGVLLTLPCIAYAEVSDKVPSPFDVWLIGLGAALICALAGRLRRWLVPVAATVPALWFLSLFLEIHSADVGPALYAEQGKLYYLHAYLALIATACCVTWGWWTGRK